MTNRDEFLNLSFHAYKLTSSLEVTPLTPTPSPPGLKTPKYEPNLNFLRNHLTNRDNFLNLSFYAFKLTSSLEVTPLTPTPSPPGLKKPLNDLTLIFSESIGPIEMTS